MGAHSRCIKDMAGMITPQRAYDIVKGCKEAGIKLEIDLHSHCTSGMTGMAYQRAIEAGKNMVKDLGLKKYEFKYDEPKPVKSLYNFDDVDESPFYDEVHQLTSIDVIEEKDGFIIADIYDENHFYIDDEDGLKLYKILKDRYRLN